MSNILFLKSLPCILFSYDLFLRAGRYMQPHRQHIRWLKTAVCQAKETQYIPKCSPNIQAHRPKITLFLYAKSACLKMESPGTRIKKICAKINFTLCPPPKCPPAKRMNIIATANIPWYSNIVLHLRIPASAASHFIPIPRTSSSVIFPNGGF